MIVTFIIIGICFSFAWIDMIAAYDGKMFGGVCAHCGHTVFGHCFLIVLARTFWHQVIGCKLCL